MPNVPPNSTSPADSDNKQLEAALSSQKLAAEDFYYEGPHLVFTAAYHLKRGSCCHSGCRHCPYRDSD
jgi:hypothetical protein